MDLLEQLKEKLLFFLSQGLANGEITKEEFDNYKKQLGEN